MKSDIADKGRKKNRSVNVKWIAGVFVCTVVISAVFSIVSSTLLSAANLLVACLVLLAIIVIGIVFDTIGVAVTVADMKPFHSMAARRVPEARDALQMLRNAEKVSSFCNDVVGDICGVISGSAAAALVLLIVAGDGGIKWRILETAMAALVSGLTVGGKALGKNLAMRESTKIVQMAAKCVYGVKCVPRAVSKQMHKKK